VKVAVLNEQLVAGPREQVQPVEFQAHPVPRGAPLLPQPPGPQTQVEGGRVR
jgi:hypothetical protein